MTGVETHIQRVQVRGAQADQPALRLRLGSLLGQADWRVPGLSPSSILMVRRLQDPLPRHIAQGSTAWRLDLRWERAVRESLAGWARKATRPHHGFIPTNAEAVFFVDEAEMLACLLLDLARGEAPGRWWWQAILRPFQSVPRTTQTQRVLSQKPALVPAIMSHLASWQQAASVVQHLAPDAAVQVLAQTLATFGKSLEDFLSDESSPLPDGEEVFSPTHQSKGERPTDFSAGKQPAIFPWHPLGLAPAAPERLGRERIALVGISLLLHQTPARLQSSTSRQMLIRWWQASGKAPIPPSISDQTPTIQKSSSAFSDGRPAITLDDDIKPKGPFPKPERQVSGERTIHSLENPPESVIAIEKKGSEIAPELERGVSSEGLSRDSFDVKDLADSRDSLVSKDSSDSKDLPDSFDSKGSSDSKGLSDVKDSLDSTDVFDAKGSSDVKDSPVSTDSLDWETATAQTTDFKADEKKHPGLSFSAQEEGVSEKQFVQEDNVSADESPRFETELEPSAEELEIGEVPASVSWGKPIATQLGGIFYLMNLISYLNLFDHLETTGLSTEEAGAWEVLDILARAMLAENPALEQDAIWACLALLEGRSPEKPPGTTLRRFGDGFRLPARWVAAQPLYWSANKTQVRVWTEVFVIAERLRTTQPVHHQVEEILGPYPALQGMANRRKPFAQAPLASCEGPLTKGFSDDLKQWLRLILPYLYHRLAQALGMSPDHRTEMIQTLFRHPGTLFVSQSHVDMVWPLEAIAVPVRLAGLDRDPGWMPDYGRVVQFYFETL